MEVLSTLNIEDSTMLFERLCAADDVHQLSGNGGVPCPMACSNVSFSKMPVHSCLIDQVLRRK